MRDREKERARRHRASVSDAGRARSRRHDRKHAEKRRAHKREIYALDPDSELRRNAIYRAQEGSKQRKAALALWRKYGMTPEDVSEMLSDQNGECPICSSPDPTNVDHEHVRGWDGMPPRERRQYVRGILCRACNLGLGYFRDHPSFCRAAAKYLTPRTRIDPAAVLELVRST